MPFLVLGDLETPVYGDCARNILHEGSSKIVLHNLKKVCRTLKST